MCSHIILTLKIWCNGKEFIFQIESGGDQILTFAALI